MKKLLLSVSVLGVLFVQAQEQEKEKTIEELILVGNRGSERTKIQTPVAVDVISVQKIQQATPQTTVQDLLNYLVPSFNSVRQSSSDGTEHIDPVTLRGMGPDQVLVLINGKRRHTTSLVNYQNTVGNGSVGTDLSTIPVIAIDRIEVLRDGAASQYGSDAIAGVINIILKKNQGVSASLTYGQTGRNDGETYQAAVNFGTELGKPKSFINFSLQLSHRGKTSRSQNHNLDIYGSNFAYDFAQDADQARAEDDAIISQRGLTRDDFNFQIGDAQIKQAQFFANAEYPISENIKLFNFGGFSLKEGQGFGFRRLPNETNSVVTAIYPNGFQPVLGSKIYDISYALGLNYKKNNWNIELSNVLGSNIFNYNVSNTNNASLGVNSPTEFNAGSHSFLQNTVNLDLSKKINQFNFAFGGEFRFEQYEIKAGEEASYAQYDIYGQIVNNNTSVSDILGLGGAQSFYGFSPTNALKKKRTSQSVYADLSYDTKRLNVDVAARFENYSDFGNTINGKIAARYELIKNLSLRGALGSGFRAPSLQQQYFNNSYADISYSGTGIVNKGIFTNDSEVAKLLGFDKLKQEKSINASLGITINPINKLLITIDGYYIKVEDRIVITSKFNHPVFANYGVENASFFANAIDTETKGIDLVASYDWLLGKGNLNLNFSANYTQTKIVNYKFPSELSATQDEFFGPDQVNIIETLSPRAKASLGINYKIAQFNFLVRNTYFGKVTRDGFPYGIVQNFSSKVVTDISVGYDVSKNINFTIGANNLFNIFPDLQTYENSYYGVFKYASVQQGMLGNYFFGRLNFNF